MCILRVFKEGVGRFIRSRLGPTVTEYAVLLALVVFGAMTAITLVGSLVSDSMQAMADAMPGSAETASSGGSGSGQSNSGKSGNNDKSGGKKNGPTRKPGKKSGGGKSRKGG